MDTGLYHGLRFFEWDDDKPELTDNDFYCKDYDHSEYVILDPNKNGLLPFGFKFPASALGNTIDANAITGKIICKETKVEQTLVFAPADWLQTNETDAVYVHYLALEQFAATTALVPGLYQIVIDNIVLDVTYKFYSDTFILKRHIAPN